MSGGIFFPLIAEKLIFKIGYAWTVRGEPHLPRITTRLLTSKYSNSASCSPDSHTRQHHRSRAAWPQEPRENHNGLVRLPRHTVLAHDGRYAYLTRLSRSCTLTRPGMFFSFLGIYFGFYYVRLPNPYLPHALTPTNQPLSPRSPPTAKPSCSSRPRTPPPSSSP